MKKDKIFYMGYYDLADGETDVALSATNKMDYIINSLIALGKEVTIVSASTGKNQQAVKGSIKQLSNGARLKIFDSLKGGNKVKRIIRRWWLLRQLYKYVNKELQEGDQVIVYHSLGYLNLIKKLKKKKVSIIYEIEEIYADVIGNKKLRDKEVKRLKMADGYLFPTEMLNQEINKSNKPYVIIHGTYNVEKPITKKLKDGRIHCVYAGTFDPRKGGAAAAAAGQFLDENYHIHILGFGSEDDKKMLINTIAETSLKTNCKITYDGLLSGEEYIRFIQGCDIGLSTQNPNADFNATSFPSKVLSYMANGLRVVSVKIKALETSAVNDLLYYYEESKPEQIAQAIRSIDMNDGYDSRERIRELDEQFKVEIREVLSYKTLREVL